jgi:hypothetical protein
MSVGSDFTARAIFLILFLFLSMSVGSDSTARVVFYYYFPFNERGE